MGRYSEIYVLDAQGHTVRLQLVFTLGALAAIEKFTKKPLIQTFEGLTADGLVELLYRGTREVHPDLTRDDIQKFSRLPLIKIAEAYNRDIGALGEAEAEPVKDMPSPPEALMT